MFSGFFGPNRKAIWNMKTPLIIYENNIELCNLKATYVL